MTAADKCHLNIPFKQTALANLQVDGEGRLDPDRLERFKADEFENYKAIERRVNDPDCGGTCGCGLVRVSTNTITLTIGGTTESFFTLTEDWSYGGIFNVSTASVDVLTTGAVRVLAQWYVEAVTVDPGTTTIGFDVYETTSASTVPFPIMASGFVLPNEGTPDLILHWASVDRYDFDGTVAPKARISVTSGSAGDQIEVRGHFTLEKVCGCSSAIPA